MLATTSLQQLPVLSDPLYATQCILLYNNITVSNDALSCANNKKWFQQIFSDVNVADVSFNTFFVDFFWCHVFVSVSYCVLSLLKCGVFFAILSVYTCILFLLWLLNVLMFLNKWIVIFFCFLFVLLLNIIHLNVYITILFALYCKFPTLCCKCPELTVIYNIHTLKSPIILFCIRFDWGALIHVI